jgi:hypothetical protein
MFYIALHDREGEGEPERRERAQTTRPDASFGLQVSFLLYFLCVFDTNRMYLRLFYQIHDKEGGIDEKG